jgi:hypothetical protein
MVNKSSGGRFNTPGKQSVGEKVEIPAKKTKYNLSNLLVPIGSNKVLPKFSHAYRP